MGLLGIFKRTASGGQPKIRSERELEAFWFAATKDKVLSQSIVEVTTNVGRYGYLIYRIQRQLFPASENPIILTRSDGQG